MKIETINHIPPEIIQYYAGILLSSPCLEFGDTLERIDKMFLYILANLHKKVTKDKQRHAKFSKLLLEFTELYANATAKEKNIEKETGHSAKRPFYCIILPDKRDQNIFERLRLKSWKIR